MSQYQLMGYRLVLPQPGLGMSPVLTLPDGWVPLGAVRQFDTVVVLCSMELTSPPAGGPPVLTSLTPNHLTVGTTPATVDVVGSGFDTSDVIYADISPRATFYVDAGHLQYTARPDLESGPVTVQIAVQGTTGTSNALPFTFT